jgi:hypothetical protein
VDLPVDNTVNNLTLSAGGKVADGRLTFPKCLFLVLRFERSAGPGTLFPPCPPLLLLVH